MFIFPFCKKFLVTFPVFLSNYSHDHLRYSSKNVGHLTKVNAKLIKVDSFDRWKLDYVSENDVIFLYFF